MFGQSHRKHSYRVVDDPRGAERDDGEGDFVRGGQVVWRHRGAAELDGNAGDHTPKRYPGGSRAYRGLFELCWNIAGQKACGSTVADTGNAFGFVGVGLLPDVPNTSGFVAPGLQISISTPPPRSRVVRAYLTDANVADQLPLYLTATPFTQMFSTGIGL